MLAKDRKIVKLNLGTAILCAVQNFGYYGVIIWLPSYLSVRFGYDLTKSSAWTGQNVLFNIGRAIGGFGPVGPCPE